MRWANKTLITSVTGNRGSNQITHNCDNWSRQWPNQLHSALVYGSVMCGVIDGRKPRDACAEAAASADQRDTHRVWGILVCRTGEGLVMRGLEIIHPSFSDLVSCLKRSLFPLFKWPSHQATYWEPLWLSFASSERNILGRAKGGPDYIMRLLGGYREIVYVEELIQAVYSDC